MSTQAEPVADSGPFNTGYVDGRVQARAAIPQDTIAPLGFLTPQDQFGDVERGNPLPYTLPPERRREVGLERETWRLEVVADPESNTKLEQPMSHAAGTALDFDGLMRLAERHAVRYLKGVTCNNIGEPLGMGLWEGVPLRVVIWQTRPVENLRRVFYYGYHNDDPAQIFQSSLPMLLCYKINGEFLSGKRGGPVRMVVPEAYGFKSVKWLQRVVLTNDYRANDTYQSGNNDLESPMKTFARFVHVPSPTQAGVPIQITGLAQVGVSGLAKVQYWLQPDDAPPADGDALFSDADWRDAEILPPPADWGLAGGPLPDAPLQFDPSTGAPRHWPLRYTIAHWAAGLPGVAPGRYTLRCRSIDMNGIAQPMPRPFPKSGRAAIQHVPLIVEP
jgi:DMSO/TMAO reductase YedYZ molybdopterin-dependent catalytic subunit